MRVTVRQLAACLQPRPEDRLVAQRLLALGRTIFLDHVIHLHETGVHAWAFPFHVLIVLGAGLLLGAMGSGLTIRRFLQV